MTRLGVVAYPALSEDDRRWIEGIRARHDPLALRIAAHMTLVFPAQVTEAAVVAQVRDTFRFSESIPVVLRRAAVSPDVAAGGYYVSLLADEGHTELLALHEALYDSIFSANGRRDIPFVPHVTVARHEERSECRRIADRIKAERRSVRARLDRVAVVEVEDSVIRAVAEIQLGSRSNQPPNPAVQQPGGSRCSPPSC